MRRAVVLIAAVGLAVTGCSSGTNHPAVAPAVHTPAASPTSVAAPATSSAAAYTSTPEDSTPSTSSTCNLPDKGDVIVREVFPNVPIDAMELGGTDPEHCTWTMDSLRTSQPTGPGYCSEVAWASDNVGYDPNAVPAPPLKKVQETIGDCG